MAGIEDLESRFQQYPSVQYLAELHREENREEGLLEAFNL